MTSNLTLTVVIEGHFNPRYCIGIGIGRGKSLTCITAVESMTSPIVITLGSSILMKCLGLLISVTLVQYK